MRLLAWASADYHIDRDRTFVTTGDASQLGTGAFNPILCYCGPEFWDPAMSATQAQRLLLYAY
jgi:hypothetical protein